MSDFTNANILVVGGAGFVGSNLVRKLLPESPRKVDVVDNLLSAEPQLPFVEFAPLPIHITAPLLAGNKMSGATYGAELFG